MLTRAQRPTHDSLNASAVTRRWGHRHAPHARPGYRPRLEALEDRCVPSSTSSPAASLSIGVQYHSENAVTIFGWLTGAPNLDNQAVDFEGMVIGDTTTGPFGYYQFEGNAAGIGSVQADAYDVPVQSAWLALENEPPAIVNFTGEETEPNMWVFSGIVDDDSPMGLEIRLRGIPALDNVVVPVEADGFFMHPAALSGTPQDNGTVIAELYDWYRQYTSATFEVVQSGT